MLKLGVSAWGLADRHRLTAFDGGGGGRPAGRDSQAQHVTAPSSWFKEIPQRHWMLSVGRVDPRNVAVVIPVRDNQAGLDAVVRSVGRMSVLPKEILVVDNLSERAVVAPPGSVPLRVLRCVVPGPAAARNLGAISTTCEWVWFVDSDCTLDRFVLEAYAGVEEACIGMCGRVMSASRRVLGRYYESQEILVPQFGEDGDPLYLVTASAMIHRPSFLSVGGFDEAFPAAAGEDIDLGLRMYASGRIRFVEGAICWHSFEEDLDKFVRRFERYGAGTRILAEKHGMSLEPRPFAPNRPTRMNWMLARVQYEALLRGYRMVDAPQPHGVAITVP